MSDYIKRVQNLWAGEIILNSVDRDGMMGGFDIEMIAEALKVAKIPLVAVGGGGNLDHYSLLF